MLGTSAKPLVSLPSFDFSQYDCVFQQEPSNANSYGTFLIPNIPYRDILEAFIFSNDNSLNGKYFLPQRTLADGNCLIHAVSPDMTKINNYDTWETHPELCRILRKHISEEMKLNIAKMKFDYTGKFNPEDWHKDPNSGRYCLTDEAWYKWCDEIRDTQAWLDVSATQALCRIIGKPILIVQPRSEHFDGGDRAIEDHAGGLMNHYSFIYHDPKFPTSVRYFNVTDLEKVHQIFTEKSPVLVYFNGQNHFSRCTAPSEQSQ